VEEWGSHITVQRRSGGYSTSGGPLTKQGPTLQWNRSSMVHSSDVGTLFVWRIRALGRLSCPQGRPAALERVCPRGGRGRVRRAAASVH